MELNFLTYLLVVAEPWSFMQDLKVFMQPWSTLHAWHDHLCSMRGLPNHLLASSSSSPSPSHFIVASSSTDFPLCPDQAMYKTIASMRGVWNCLSIKYLFTPNGLRSSELWSFYSGAAICPKLISDCTSLNFSDISPCTGLQIHWSWMH
jgi:hypothetical protein